MPDGQQQLELVLTTVCRYVTTEPFKAGAFQHHASLWSFSCGSGIAIAVMLFGTSAWQLLFHQTARDRFPKKRCAVKRGLTALWEQPRKEASNQEKQYWLGIWDCGHGGIPFVEGHYFYRNLSWLWFLEVDRVRNQSLWNISQKHSFEQLRVRRASRLLSDFSQTSVSHKQWTSGDNLLPVDIEWHRGMFLMWPYMFLFFDDIAFCCCWYDIMMSEYTASI